MGRAKKMVKAAVRAPATSGVGVGLVPLVVAVLGPQPTKATTAAAEIRSPR